MKEHARKSTLIGRMLAPLSRNSRLFIRTLTVVNIFVYRLSGGRLGDHVEGSPICLVTMTGRKSGRQLTIALVYTPHGDDVLLVASQGGADEHPLWYHNLKAQPRIDIEVDGVRRAMLAREAEAAEHARLWPVVNRNYPAFASYQTKTTRRLPIFVCSPT